jgi:hypothetical protein
VETRYNSFPLFISRWDGKPDMSAKKNPPGRKNRYPTDLFRLETRATRFH